MRFHISSRSRRFAGTAGVFVLLAGLGLASGALPAGAVAAATPSVSATTRGPCPDGLPPSGQFVSSTSTSLTFSFVVNAPAQPPGCGLSTATTVNVTDRHPDHETVRVTGAPDLPSGTLTVTGLQPGTDYWFSFTGGGSPFGGPSQGPVRTLAGAGPCTASYETVSSWNSGFLGKITIRNTSASPLDEWELGWTFTRGERLTGAYNATITGTIDSPVLTPPSWMAAVPVGGSQAITILVAGRPAPASLPVSCSAG